VFLLCHFTKALLYVYKYRTELQCQKTVCFGDGQFSLFWFINRLSSADLSAQELPSVCGSTLCTASTCFLVTVLTSYSNRNVFCTLFQEGVKWELSRMSNHHDDYQQRLTWVNRHTTG